MLALLGLNACYEKQEPSIRNRANRARLRRASIGSPASESPDARSEANRHAIHA